MSLFTSPQFAASAAEGADWREASKKVLTALEKAEGEYNFGILYISDLLADDAESILNLFKSVLNIENWVGTIGIGVCGNGEEFIDKPAISAMIGALDPADFCLFPAMNTDTAEAQTALGPWLENNDPMLILCHADPVAEEDPAVTLRRLEQLVGGFVTGGLSSSRSEHMQFAREMYQNGASGAVFSERVKVASTLSQGCTPVSGVHTITRGDDHIIRELDGQKAQEVFEDDLRQMAIDKIGKDPDEILLDEDVLSALETMPDEYKKIFDGEISVAFPVSGSDQNDYLVRNIIGFDEDGALMVAQNIMNGETLMFVHRNEETVREDLSKQLIELRKRVEKDTGRFEPKAAVYVSCVARAFKEKQDPETSEMQLVRDIIGDVPLAGFYAGGEINSARLYGYTGILTLFL